MKQIRNLFLCMLGAATVGCSGAQPTADRPPPDVVKPDVAKYALSHDDFVQYVLSSEDTDVRILLVWDGARVDIRNGHQRGTHVRTAIIPTDPNEVCRLVCVVDSLIESSAPGPVARANRLPAPKDKTLVIRCRKAGRDRSARVIGRAGKFDLPWKRVAGEIEVVGSLKVAKALDAYRNSQLRKKQGDLRAAAEAHYSAFNRFSYWAMRRCARYGKILEPGEDRRRSFRYPRRKGEWLEVRGYPVDVWDLPGITPEWAVKFAQYAWDVVTEGMILSRSGHMVVISFSEELRTKGWMSRLPGATMSPKALDILKRAPPMGNLRTPH